MEAEPFTQDDVNHHDRVTHIYNIDALLGRLQVAENELYNGIEEMQSIAANLYHTKVHYEKDH
jgi:hypothetical protein